MLRQVFTLKYFLIRIDNGSLEVVCQEYDHYTQNQRCNFITSFEIHEIEELDSLKTPSKAERENKRTHVDMQPQVFWLAFSGCPSPVPLFHYAGRMNLRILGPTEPEQELLKMIYKPKFYFLCKASLSAEGPQDVEVIDKAARNEDFPDLFRKFEELRSHAFNEDKLYSVVRADDIYELVRTGDEKEAKEEVFEKARPEIITNLQHRMMQKNDKNDQAIVDDELGIED